MKKFGICVLACFSLLGCGGEKSEPTKAQETTSTLPVVSVVTSGNVPPFEFVDEHGAPMGIEVDIIRAVAENQGFIKAEFHREQFPDILPAISAGKYQVAISDITVTPERAEKFDHSTPYITNPTVIAYTPNFTVQGLSDLKALRVGTLKGSYHQKIVNDIAPTQHDNAGTSFQLVQGVAQNKYDAILNEKYVMEYLLGKYPEVKATTTPIPTDSDKIAMFVQKGNQELLGKLNAGITHLQQTGELDKIIAKYIKNPTK